MNFLRTRKDILVSLIDVARIFAVECDDKSTRCMAAMRDGEILELSLPFGSVGYEPEPNERGERLIWLEDGMADRLGAMRGPDESFSDAIIRIAGQEALATRRG